MGCGLLNGTSCPLIFEVVGVPTIGVEATSSGALTLLGRPTLRFVGSAGDDWATPGTGSTCSCAGIGVGFCGGGWTGTGNIWSFPDSCAAFPDDLFEIIGMAVGVVRMNGLDTSRTGAPVLADFFSLIGFTLGRPTGLLSDLSMIGRILGRPTLLFSVVGVLVVVFAITAISAGFGVAELGFRLLRPKSSSSENAKLGSIVFLENVSWFAPDEGFAAAVFGGGTAESILDGGGGNPETASAGNDDAGGNEGEAVDAKPGLRPVQFDTLLRGVPSPWLNLRMGSEVSMRTSSSSSLSPIVIALATLPKLSGNDLRNIDRCGTE